VAIVGESGAGKTTLAQCIVGLQRNWTGEVSLDGESLATEAQHRQRDVLRRVQYVFQNPYLSLNPRKTIAQIVGEPLRHFFSLRGAQADERVASALDDVSLGGEYLERYPDQLSGGERQRVAIARALIVEPEVLVCDEITSALDVSVQAVIVELLRRLQLEHHLSMIFITHNLALVRSVAQACVVLSEGRVVESGNVDDVLDRPTHPYTAQLISDIPMLEADRGGLAVGGEYRT
jgi:peptide/nickel transport system ATP-binding protein